MKANLRFHLPYTITLEQLQAVKVVEKSKSVYIGTGKVMFQVTKSKIIKYIATWFLLVLGMMSAIESCSQPQDPPSSSGSPKFHRYESVPQTYVGVIKLFIYQLLYAEPI